MAGHGGYCFHVPSKPHREIEPCCLKRLGGLGWSPWVLAGCDTIPQHTTPGITKTEIGFVQLTLKRYILSLMPHPDDKKKQKPLFKKVVEKFHLTEPEIRQIINNSQELSLDRDVWVRRVSPPVKKDTH